MTNKTCPLCKKPLTLQQINLNLAVYICEDLSCSYPVGYECKVVNRRLEDMDRAVDRLSEKGCENLDSWMDEVVEEKRTETKIDITNEATKHESDGWISDLVEEAVNEARRYEAAKEGSGDNSQSLDDLDVFLDFL